MASNTGRISLMDLLAIWHINELHSTPASWHSIPPPRDTPPHLTVPRTNDNMLTMHGPDTLEALEVPELNGHVRWTGGEQLSSVVKGNVLHRVCVALEGPFKVTRFIVPYLVQTQNTCFKMNISSIEKPLPCLAACYDKVKHKIQVWACSCYSAKHLSCSQLLNTIKHARLPSGYNLKILFRLYLPQERIVRISSHINLAVSTALQAKTVAEYFDIMCQH